MPEYDVVILTDSRYENPVAPGAYVQNVLTEDRLVLEALENTGLKVTRKAWSNPDFDWSSTKAVLFRSTWDYFHHYTKFRKWLDEIEHKTCLINSPRLIKWNIDKKYLSSLSQNGISIIPTRFVPRGTGISIQELHTLTGWKHTVIKPTIGGGGRFTHSIDAKNISVITQKLQPVMKNEDFMLQPFQYSVTTQGEWSFMFFGKEYSHAVLKKARKGDFRVQDDYGGTVHPHEATEQEIDFARKAVLACPELPAYSRVDVLLNNDGNLAVSELELIEPELWFRIKPEAANLMAREVNQKLNSLNGT